MAELQREPHCPQGHGRERETAWRNGTREVREAGVAPQSIPGPGGRAGTVAPREHAAVGRHPEAGPVFVGWQHGQAGRRVVGVG